MDRSHRQGDAGCGRGSPQLRRAPARLLWYVGQRQRQRHEVPHEPPLIPLPERLPRRVLPHRRQHPHPPRRRPRQPRPEQPQYVQEFAQTIPKYVRRHREKAGLTGWAQINDLRGDTSIVSRTTADLYTVFGLHRTCGITSDATCITDRWKDAAARRAIPERNVAKFIHCSTAHPTRCRIRRIRGLLIYRMCTIRIAQFIPAHAGNTAPTFAPHRNRMIDDE